MHITLQYDELRNDKFISAINENDDQRGVQNRKKGIWELHHPTGVVILAVLTATWASSLYQCDIIALSLVDVCFCENSIVTSSLAATWASLNRMTLRLYTSRKTGPMAISVTVLRVGARCFLSQKSRIYN